MNLTLRLWSGCLDTAKIPFLRTQSGRNSKEIRRLSILTVNSRAANDPIYGKGAVIAYLWKPNPDSVCFDGIPFDPFMMKLNSLREKGIGW